MEQAFVIVTCATGSRAEAAAIATALVARRLAACVQIVPVESVYRWEGTVREAPEFVLHIKTVAARFAAVEAVIRALHSYDVPEIVAVPVAAIAAGYADWIAGAVASEG